VTFTQEELRVMKEALVEFMMLNEDGQCAVQYPIDKEIASNLYNKIEGTWVQN
jgi:hypothetical protein